MELDEQSLRVLSCDIEVRPRNAAGIEHLLPYLVKMEEHGDTLLVDFDTGGADLVESFVAAERLCCTELTWAITRTPDLLQIAIGGKPEQTALLKQWFEQY